MPSPFSASLQRILDRCAIPGLIRFVVIFNALVFVLQRLVPGFLGTLTLNPSLILHGEVWRLLTWIFIPKTFSVFWIFFALLFLFSIGESLEEAIGSTKLTLFYLSGVVACTLVAFVFGLIDPGIDLGYANIFLNLSLLLAYATVNPNSTVYFMFFIPMKMAWLAVISAVLMIFATLGQPLVVPATLGAALLNFILFFRRDLQDFFSSLNSGHTRSTSPAFRSSSKKEVTESLHRCATCGRTEVSHPELDFRVALSGEEYCREHLTK